MEVGRLFRHFFIAAKIGEGKMCEVHLGFDIVRQCFAAVKTLHEHHAQVTSFVNRLKREAEIYKRMNHKNIVGYHDSDLDREPRYLAMEFLKGEPLTLRLRNEGGSLFLHDAVRILEDIAEALHWAHRNNIVHRDIRPDNIMVDFDGNAKLYDFGIAYAEDDIVQTRVGDIAKLGLYASPEQIMGRKMDARSDLYSLGVVFYEMLTGKKIHLARTLPEFLQLFKQPIAPPSTLDPTIPPPIDKITLKLLQFNPEERYQSARELLIETGNLRLQGEKEMIEKIFGREADLLFEKAKRCYEEGEYHDTIRICQSIEEEDVRRKASLYLLIAHTAEKMNRPDVSLRYYEKAAFMQQDDFQYALDYFSELVRRGMYDKARIVLHNQYKRSLDREIVGNLEKMLARWDTDEFKEAREKYAGELEERERREALERERESSRAGEEGGGGFLSRLKSLFSG